MSEEKASKPIYKKWWFWLIMVFVFIGVFGSGGGSKSSSNSSSSSASISTPSEPPKLDPIDAKRPEIEARFIEAVTAARAKSKDADNDMQRGSAKSERDKNVCALLKNLKAKDWTGKITNITSNSDGKGVIEVEIAKNITVKTWNNALSDIGDHTLIEPGTKFFDFVAGLKKGTVIQFSGNFFRGSSGDCLKESSMSLRGKIEDPEFIFNFVEIGTI
jgi:hypothetical protein